MQVMLPKERRPDLSDSISAIKDNLHNQAIFTVSVNGKSQAISTSTTVDALLTQLQLNSSKGIAVAVNSQVISRGEWGNYVLNQNDEVLLITAAQGG
jgi:sulfur carrier protein